MQSEYCSPYPQIPPDAYWLCLRSGMAAELIRFNPSQCVCFHQLRLCCVPAPSQLWRSGGLCNRYAGLLFLLDAEHNAAIQHRADRAGQEVVHRNKIHPVNFQNKIHGVHGGSYFPALHLENYIMGRGRPEVNRSEVFRRHFTPLTPWTRRY